MSRTCSVCKVFYFISLCLFIVLASCKDKNDSAIINKDSTYTDTSSNYVSISDSALSTILDKTISEFSVRNNASDNWTIYSIGNKANADKSLKNRNLVFPVFREQIMYLHQSDVTDTILVYYGDKSNTFVIKISKGESMFDRLNSLSNGLITVKVNSIEHSQKLYLIKKYTDFQHKEKNVTEFYINAELTDVTNIGIKDKLLREKFKLED
jgi:hypothetical protein